MSLLRTIFLYFILLGCNTSSYASNITNLLPTELSIKLIVWWICISLFVGTSLWLFYNVLNYRKKNQNNYFHKNKWAEVIWTSVPLFIMLILALPASKTLI